MPPCYDGRLCRMNLAVHGLEGTIRHGGDSSSTLKTRTSPWEPSTS